MLAEKERQEALIMLSPFQTVSKNGLQSENPIAPPTIPQPHALKVNYLHNFLV